MAQTLRMVVQILNSEIWIDRVSLLPVAQQVLGPASKNLRSIRFLRLLFYLN
jgi:hypothetical protein